jgi:uncharacterized membrane protein YphA (DoxX/SURF4 family)
VSLDNKIVDNVKKVLLSHRFYILIRVIIGSVFIYAGFIKLIDPKAFAKAISQFDVVPEFLLAPLAIGLPALEFFAGLGLIFNIRGSLQVIFNLLIVFILVLGYGIFNDLDIDCGCFSPEEISAYNSLKLALFRDILMVMAVCYIYIYKRIKNETNSNHLMVKDKTQHEEEMK